MYRPPKVEDELLLAVITALRPYLEAASFTATVVLVVGLIFSRSQLSAFYRDANTRNERLAKEKAIEAAARYLTEYCRLDEIDFRKRKELGIDPYRGEVGDFTLESLDKKSLQNVLKHSYSEWDTSRPALNELEIISSYFTSGVADERTGFKIIGRSFCSSVRINYAAMTMLNGNHSAQPYWYNIVTLYNIWIPRLTREELEKSSQQLSRTIASLPEDRPIAPIGC